MVEVLYTTYSSLLIRDELRIARDLRESLLYKVLGFLPLKEKVITCTSQNISEKAQLSKRLRRINETITANGIR
jgi:hypothetical protein